MTGWIKIHREITEHWIFQDAEKFKWWVDLLIMASHEGCKTLVNGDLVSLKRGQLTVSLSFLSSRWGRSKEKVLNFLRLLESDHMIERKADRKSTTITICNYDSYQDVPEQTPTANQTDVRPMSDQSPTEYKNVEECKEYKLTNSAHVCEENIQTWVAEREQQFCNTFKGLGAAIPLATKTGKTASDILKLLDIYMAHRQLKNLGHLDYRAFVNLFTWHIEQNRITIPTQPEQEKPKKKVKTNEDFYKEMYG
jgi:hypothetical protein